MWLLRTWNSDQLPRKCSKEAPRKAPKTGPEDSTKVLTNNGSF